MELQTTKRSFEKFSWKFSIKLIYLPIEIDSNIQQSTIAIDQFNRHRFIKYLLLHFIFIERKK